MSIRDLILELRINWQRRKLLNAAPVDRRPCAAEFTRLIRLRSPERARQMERDRGLV